MARENQVPLTVVLANAAAIATLVPIALHQMGRLRHLPDPRSDLFDSDGITDSEAAHPFGIPDGLLGLASFGATLALSLVASSYPKARGLLAAKIAGDTAFAGFNVARQVVSFGKLCSWCTGTALCTFVSAAAAGPLLKAEGQSLHHMARLRRTTQWLQRLC